MGENETPGYWPSLGVWLNFLLAVVALALQRGGDPLRAPTGL